MRIAALLLFLFFQNALGSRQIALRSSPNLLLKKSSSKEEVSWTGTLREGACGALAGAVQVVGLMWLRTTMSYQHRYGLTMKEALRELYIQGGIPRFYKGLGFALIQAPLSKFGSVAANDCSLILNNYLNSTRMNVLLTTAIGGVLATLIRGALMPIDTCKTVLQVDGKPGFEKLVQKVMSGKLAVLYQGTAATLFTTFAGHYPWYLVHNSLEKSLPSPTTKSLKILKSSLIALAATIFSDLVTNALRVVKTVKQTTMGNRPLTYSGIVMTLLQQGGIKELFLRGLAVRILADCLQSLVFTIVWKMLSNR